MATRRKIKRHSRKAGLAPGTLLHIGERKLEAARVTVINYDEGSLEEATVDRVAECYQFKTTPGVSWISVEGLHDTALIEELGKHFGIHALTLEDILNTGQRPKCEDMENYVFVVLKMLHFDHESQTVLSEQVGIVLGSGYVLSFQESGQDVFGPIRSRLIKAKGRIRKMGSDYLVYSLLDAIVDSYFGILEELGEKIEALEETLVSEPTRETLEQIHHLKKELVFLRRSFWPLREVVSGMERSESSLIKEATGVYLRDVYDHAIQIMDTVESYRDMVSGMLDIYLSSISNRTNAVMKVLTIIATIFIPLTFVAGVYGMNFKYMPELEWKWGYLVVWMVMAIISLGMLIYFKRKRWL